MSAIKCPVCGDLCISWKDSQENVVHEAQDKCPNGCWYYYYAFGGHEESVGYREWYWHYTDPAEKVNKIREEIKAAITAERIAEQPAAAAQEKEAQ